MFERFTEKAIKVIMLAQEESRRLGHNFVGTEQILLGLIGEGTGVAAKALKLTGINLKEARIEVEKIIGRGSGFVAVDIPFTPRAKRVLELSIEEAQKLEHKYIGTEHLLLGLIHEGEGVAVRVLENLRANLPEVRAQVIRMLSETHDQPLEEFQKLIELYERQLADAQDIKDKNLENQALRLIGIAYLRAGKFKESTLYFERQISITKELGDLNGEGEALGNLGLAFKGQRQYQAAIRCFEEFLRLSKELNSWLCQSWTLKELGNVYELLYQYQAAAECYELQLPIAKKTEDRLQEADSLRNLASSYINLGRFQEAIELDEQALNIYKEIGNRIGEANSLLGLGSSFQSLSEFQRSLTSREQALSIYEENNSIAGRAYAFQAIASSYSQLSNYPKALENYEQSLVLFRQLGNQTGEANVLCNIGNTYGKLKDYEKATQFLEKSFSIMKEQGDISGEASCLGYLGFIALSLNNYERALELSISCQRLYDQIGNIFSGAFYGYFVHGKALVNLSDERVGEGIEYLKRAHQLLWLTGDRNYIKQVSEELQRNGIRIVQTLLDNSNIGDVYIKESSQKISQRIVNNYEIVPGDPSPESKEISFIEQVFVKNVNANNITFENVTQLIELVTVNNYFDAKLAETCVFSLATLFEPQATLRDKKTRILQALKVCAESNHLAIAGVAKQYYDELEAMPDSGWEDFLSPNSKNGRKARERVGWIMFGAVVGIPAGSAATLAFLELFNERDKPINGRDQDPDKLPSGSSNEEDLKPRPGGRKDPNSPRSDPSNRDDLRRSRKSSSLEEYLIKRRSLPPDPNSLARSTQNQPLENQSSDGLKGVDLSNFRRNSDLDSFSKSQFQSPLSSGSGGGFSSSEDNLHSLSPIGSHISESNFSDIATELVGSRSVVSNNFSIAPSSDSPIVDIGSSSSGSFGDCGFGDCEPCDALGDCNACDIGDCNACEIGDCSGCEPSCDCFIATAVYGDYNAPQVIILRRFRDEKLIPHFWGRLLVDSYYYLSPPLARYLKKSPKIAKPVRSFLNVLTAWINH